MQNKLYFSGLNLSVDTIILTARVLLQIFKF